MRTTRRHFIAGSSAVFLAGSPLSRSLAGPSEKRNLIVVMLRGGMDGLTAKPSIKFALYLQQTVKKVNLR